MRRLFFTILFMAGITPAIATAQTKGDLKSSAGSTAPQTRPDPAPAADAGEKMTVNDCLIILSGLNGLDGRQVVTNAGKSNEQVATIPFEFGSSKLRLDIARNLSALSAIQRDGDQVRQKIFAEVSKGATEIKPGTAQAAEYDRQMRELTTRPCTVDLARIKASDLKLDRNDIPGSILAALDRILDK